jgi:hypothetical protein
MKGKKVNLTKRCLEVIKASQEPIDSVSIYKILKAGKAFKNKKYANEENKKSTVSSILSVLCRKGIIQNSHIKDKKIYYTTKTKKITSVPLSEKFVKPINKYKRGHLERLCYNVVYSRKGLSSPNSVADKLVKTVSRFSDHYKDEASMRASVSHVLNKLFIKNKIKRVIKKGKKKLYCRLDAKHLSYGIQHWTYKPNEKGKKDISIKIIRKEAKGPGPSSLDIKLNELIGKKKLIEEDIQAIIKVKEMLKR